jgi:hypothetical protein
VTTRALPTRTLPPHPDLRQIRRQAKQLLDGFTRGDGAAVAEVTAHYHSAQAATFALHDAQLVIARAYGFESWPKLKAAVQGVTIERLADAVRARDLRRVRDGIAFDRNSFVGTGASAGLQLLAGNQNPK